MRNIIGKSLRYKQNDRLQTMRLYDRNALQGDDSTQLCGETYHTTLSVVWYFIPVGRKGRFHQHWGHISTRPM